MSEFSQGILIIAIVIIVVLIVKRLKKNKNSNEVDKPKKQTIRYAIVGMKYRRNRDVKEGNFDGFALAETNNKHDKNAVVVMSTNNKIIGYVPKRENEVLWKKLSELPGRQKQVKGYLSRNDDDKWYGSFDIYI